MRTTSNKGLNAEQIRQETWRKYDETLAYVRNRIVCADELAEALGISQSSASSRLDRLFRLGALECELEMESRGVKRRKFFRYVRDWREV